jgi:hypothetical protein
MRIDKSSPSTADLLHAAVRHAALVQHWRRIAFASWCATAALIVMVVILALRVL